MARELLSDEALRQATEGLAWDRRGNELVRTFRFADFKAAMVFVNQVADLAEARNHHPDIEISWNKVTLTLSTHASGGLTDLDVELARAIDALGS